MFVCKHYVYIMLYCKHYVNNNFNNNVMVCRDGSSTAANHTTAQVCDTIHDKLLHVRDT